MDGSSRNDDEEGEALGSPRVLIYSHDTFGLGHLRRSVRIAGALAELSENPSVLIATGSAQSEAFALPPGCDVLKLPCVTKLGDGTYHSLRLNGTLQHVKSLRSSLLATAERYFQPDVILVDHAPVGMEGELEALLQGVRHCKDRPSVILGLRDVIDDHVRVRAEWARLGAWDYITTLYDKVLVYGDPRMMTTAQELNLPQRLGGRLSYTGYVAPAAPSPDRTRVPGRIVATVGGGADGEALASAFVEAVVALECPNDFDPILVLGPFASPALKARLLDRAMSSKTRLSIAGFDARLDELLASASGVVAMAGYNTVAELLTLQTPSLLVPRQEPRLEQLIRTTRLSERVPFLAQVSEGQDLEAAISKFLMELPPTPNPTPSLDLDVGGAMTIARELQRFFRGRQRGAKEGKHARFAF